MILFSFLMCSYIHIGICCSGAGAGEYRGQCAGTPGPPPGGAGPGAGRQAESGVQAAEVGGGGGGKALPGPPGRKLLHEGGAGPSGAHR